MDTVAGIMQIRLWPTPDEAMSLELAYDAEAPAFASTSAKTAMPANVITMYTLMTPNVLFRN
jgi:hypothetical protein